MSKSIYSNEYENLVKKLREARTAVKLTQNDVAKKIKKPQSYVSKVENGEQRIDIIEMKKFADLYKKDIGTFNIEVQHLLIHSIPHKVSSSQVVFLGEN